MPVINLNRPTGKIWLNAIPENWKYVGDEMRESSLVAVAHAGRVERSLCLSLQVLGANQAGLLGATFKPDKTTQLLVRVQLMKQFRGDVFPHVGLPDNLALVVLNQASDYLTKQNNLGSGILDFDCALWDEANSSPYLFKWLTRSVLKMLELDNDAFTTETLTNTVESMKNP